jgi:hypothetical protein
MARSGLGKSRLSVSAAVALILGAGAFAALANFVPWPIAAAFGMLSAGVGLAGAHRWNGFIAHKALLDEWNRATQPGPTSDLASTGDSLLTALNPDREVVAFSPQRESELQAVLRWCTDDSAKQVLLVTGEAGCGKTRLLIEAAARLQSPWLCGWIRRGQGPAAVALAVQWKRPVLLVMDDADTLADLTDTITGLARNGGQVRLLLATRQIGRWWVQLRGRLDSDVDAILAPPGPPLSNLSTTGHDQRQRFTQAVRAFARRWDATPPAAALAVPNPPVQLLLIHGAAAVTVADNLSGTVELDDALRRLFTLEELWWQRSASAACLAPLGLPVLRAVVVAGVLVGADSLDDAVNVLRYLPGLTTASDDLLSDLALWLRGLYPNKAGSWLNPHLPGRLAERYVTNQLATNPPLLAAIAAASILAGERS